MSFSHNPFKHIEIVHDPNSGYSGQSEEYVRNNPYVVYCHGCGSSRMRVNENVRLIDMFAMMAEHVQKSHERTPEDMEGWSAY